MSVRRAQETLSMIAGIILVAMVAILVGIYAGDMLGAP